MNKVNAIFSLFATTTANIDPHPHEDPLERWTKEGQDLISNEVFQNQLKEELAKSPELLITQFMTAEEMQWNLDFWGEVYNEFQEHLERILKRIMEIGGNINLELDDGSGLKYAAIKDSEALKREFASLEPLEKKKMLKFATRFVNRYQTQLKTMPNTSPEVIYILNDIADKDGDMLEKHFEQVFQHLIEQLEVIPNETFKIMAAHIKQEIKTRLGEEEFLTKNILP